MTQLVYDIYGPTYPVITTRLVRLSAGHVVGSANPAAGHPGTNFLAGRPMGSGSITIEKGSPHLTATNFAVGNYVIVRDLDLHPSNDTANVLGGFYLEEGDFLLVSDNPKTLTFKGRSTISVLERAIMGPESLSPFEGPHSIEAGYWRWGSDTYGGVMRRALFEANYQDPPGLPMISTLTVGVDNIFWDDDNDSNGNPWPNFAGEFRTQCGTTLFDLYRQMYGYGVELEIDARTFDVYAFNADGYGTDRTSGTFATGKVRLVAGINIAADLTRQIHGRLPRTHLLVRTTDYPEGAWIASDDYTPGDPVFKGVYQSGDISGDPKASPALQSRAQRNMDLRQLAEDGIRIPMIEPGFVPLSGRYTPGPNFAVGPTVTTGHVWYADRITLHTGSHTMDYANASVKVEAIEYVLREAGDWQPIIHIGPRGFLQFPGAFGPGLPGPASPTGPSLAGQCLSGDESLKYGSVGSGGNSPYRAFDCNDLTHYGSSSPTIAGQYLARDFGVAVTSTQWRVLQDTNIGFRATDMKIYGTNNSTAWAAVSGSPYNWAGAPDWVEVADVTLAPGESSGTYASASYRYWAFQPRTTEGGGFNGWIVFTIEIGESGDTPLPPGEPDPGTPGTYAPLGHRHPPGTESASDPTVNDDSSEGFTEGSTWVNTTTNVAFILVDDAVGAAVWQQIGASSSAGRTFAFFAS